MTGWLHCTISPGQFSGEYAIRSSMFDGTEFSLFASKEDLKYIKEPTDIKSVEGSIRIIPLQEQDDLIMVRLPRPTFENGQSVTVKKEQVRF